MTDHAGDRILRDAVLSGLEGRELEHLARLLGRGTWREEDADRATHLRLLGRCIAREADPARVYKLMALLAEEQPTWRRIALADGVLGALPKGEGRARSLPVAIEPTFLRDLPSRVEEPLARKLRSLFAALRWPGLDGEALGPVALQGAGRKIYTSLCAACHQADGSGLPGLAPPLRGTPWVSGPPGRLVRIILHGLQGPIEVDGERYDLLMPGLAHLTDPQVAAVSSFVRQEFGPRATAIFTDAVTRVRLATEGRVKPWTVQELQKIR